MSLGEIGLSTALVHKDSHHLVMKEELEASMLTVEAASLLPRAIEKGIEGACNSTEVSRRVCNTAGQFVSNLGKDAVSAGAYLLSSSTKASFEAALQKIQSNADRTPAVWEKEYGIPRKKTEHALESLRILAEGAVTAPIGYGAGALVAKSLAVSKVGNCLKYLPKKLAKKEAQILNEIEILIEDIAPVINDSSTFLEGAYYKQGETFHFYIELLVSKSSKNSLRGLSRNSGSLFKALNEIKILASKMKAKKIQVSFIAANPKLLELVKKTYPYIGKIPHVLVDEMQYTRDPFKAHTFQIIEKGFKPKKTSTIPAKWGAIEPILSEGLKEKGPVTQSSGTLLDSAIAVTLVGIPFFGKIPLTQLNSAFRSGRNLVVQFIKHDGGGVRMFTTKYPSASAKEMVKHFEKQGYKVADGGKGDHYKLKKIGSPIVMISKEKTLLKGLAVKPWKQLEAMDTNRAPITPFLAQTAKEISFESPISKELAAFLERTENVFFPIARMNEEPVSEEQQLQEDKEIPIPPLEINLSPSLTNPKESSIEIVHNYNENTNVSFSIVALQPKRSSISASKQIDDTTGIGIVANPLEIHKTQIVVSLKLPKIGMMHAAINLAKPLESSLSAEIPVGRIVSLKGNFNLKKPELSRVQVFIPTGPLNFLTKPLGFHHQIPIGSITIKRMATKATKVFRKIFGGKHKSYDKASSLQPSFMHTLQQLENSIAQLTQTAQAQKNSIERLPSLQMAFTDTNAAVKSLNASIQQLEALNNAVNQEHLEKSIHTLTVNAEELSSTAYRSEDLYAKLEKNQTVLAQKLHAKISPHLLSGLQQKLKRAFK